LTCIIKLAKAKAYLTKCTHLYLFN